MRTDRTIPNNKPDIVIRGNKQGTIMLIDALVPGDRNVIKKEAKKILKYKDHIIDIQRMWNVKAKGIPKIIWGNWNQFKSTQTVPEQHTRKARN
jgi:hypothetical protein